MNLYSCEKRLLDDLKIIIKRKHELEDRYPQLDYLELQELDFITLVLRLYIEKLKYYKTNFKSS